MTTLSLVMKFVSSKLHITTLNAYLGLMLYMSQKEKKRSFKFWRNTFLKPQKSMYEKNRSLLNVNYRKQCAHSFPTRRLLRDTKI